MDSRDSKDRLGPIVKPRLIVLDTAKDIDGLKEYLRQFDYIAYDSETTGLHKSSEVIGVSFCAEEDKAYYVVIKAWDKETQRLIPTGTENAVKDLLEALKGRSLVMHNAVFDCMMAESYFNVSLIDSLHTDTIVLAHLLNENRRVGLKELSKTYFGEDSAEEQRRMKESVIANGGKLTKDCYEMYKADSQLLGYYGAQDALLTYKLFIQLVSELYDQGLEDFFYKDESMPLLKGPTYQLNTVGLKVDQERLITLQKQLEAECFEAKAFVYSEIDLYIKEKYPGTNKKNQFNISSNQQLAWLLFGQFKLSYGTLTKEGKAVCRGLGIRTPYTKQSQRDFIDICELQKGSVYQPEGYINGRKVNAKKVKDPWAYIMVDKKTLTKLAPKYEWISKLLEYKQKTKILETYVLGISERVKYGIIQPSFLQHGTTSGRYSSRDPNFQNLPRDDKRIKECIVSRPGKVFVGADYSQLEPRVFAFVSGDSRLREAFKGESDFYSVIGMEVYGCYDCTPQKDGSPDAFGIKYKKLRDLSKVIALASTYGATAYQLASTTGKSKEDTQEDIDSYFEKFPDVAKMMLESHKLAKSQGFVTTIFGRPRRIPEAKHIEKLYGDTHHAELPYEARKLLNLAVNHRIQGTGASIVNRSAIKFNDHRKLAGIDCQIVLQVHDSLVVECNEEDAENVSILLQNAMENTVDLNTIKLEAVPKSGKNLSEV